MHPIAGLADWRTFEDYARRYFSDTWHTNLKPRTVRIGGQVDYKFDLVSADQRIVGDAKWLKNIRDPAAKWQGISEYVWLLQKVKADKLFMVFGQDVEVPERYLKRMRPLIAPVEFYSWTTQGIDGSDAAACPIPIHDAAQRLSPQFCQYLPSYWRYISCELSVPGGSRTVRRRSA